MLSALKFSASTFPFSSLADPPEHDGHSNLISFGGSVGETHKIHTNTKVKFGKWTNLMNISNTNLAPELSDDPEHYVFNINLYIFNITSSCLRGHV